MSDFTLDTIAPDTCLKLTFCPTERGMTYVRVLSTDKTDVYALNNYEKDAYDRDEEFKSLVSSEDRTVHLFKLEAPSKWWLFIANYGDKEVSCSYEVMW